MFKKILVALENTSADESLVPQIQKLASILYPDGPNDTAPSAYNEGAARPGLPQSPLQPVEGAGF